MNRLLPEDYVTCVAEDDSGNLRLGFRQQGLAALDLKSNRVVFQAAKKQGVPDDFVTAILPAAPDRPLLATYVAGLGRTEKPFRLGDDQPEKRAAGDKEFAPDKFPALPKAAVAPSAEEFDELRKQIEVAPEGKLKAAFLGEDWASKGDWVGRYGRESAMLCAMASPLNHEIGWDGRYVIQGFVGPHCTKDDGLRHWVHWPKTDNRNSLYTPVVGYRRQSEWDDHGEAYPLTHDGPDVWVRVEVPDGIYRMSLYFFNKDGHDGMNRVHDYLVQIKPYFKDARRAETAAPLALCRVHHFWNGV